MQLLIEITHQPITNGTLIIIIVNLRPQRSIKAPASRHPSAIGSNTIDAAMKEEHNSNESNRYKMVVDLSSIIPIQLEISRSILILLCGICNSGNNMAEYPIHMPTLIVVVVTPMLAII